MTSVFTPSFAAIRNPLALGLFDITTDGLIGIFCFFIVFRIASMLLPRPEIRIPKCSNNYNLFLVKIKHLISR